MALAKRNGEIHVNPLKYHRERVMVACFTAARMGLLRKERVNAGWYIFYPIRGAK